MRRMCRGEEIFKPLNTGGACVREWVTNIFCRKGDTTILIDAGYKRTT